MVVVSRSGLTTSLTCPLPPDAGCLVLVTVWAILHRPVIVRESRQCWVIQCFSFSSGENLREGTTRGRDAQPDHGVHALSKLDIDICCGMFVPFLAIFQLPE